MTRRPTTLRRVTGLGRVASVLVVAAAAAAVLSVVAMLTARDDAESFLAGAIDGDDFLRAVSPFAIFSLVQTLTVLAAAVVVIVWMYRVASNLRALHRGATWGPGWSIGGWFAPPMIPVIPLLTLREMWKASAPEVPVGGRWAGERAPAITIAWFVVFGPLQLAVQLIGFVDGFAGLGADEAALAEQISSDLTLPVVSAVVDVVAAALFVAVVRGIVGRHAALTGEATPATGRAGG